jgi:ParB/RepB/Spo0J family partition protein
MSQAISQTNLLHNDDGDHVALPSSETQSVGHKATDGAAKVGVVRINDIVIRDRRPLHQDTVDQLAQSIKKIGLQTPITVRYVDGSAVLVAGLHRLEAVRSLRWDEIAAVPFRGDDTAARQWEISENLHRAELSVLERS